MLIFIFKAVSVTSLSMILQQHYQECYRWTHVVALTNIISADFTGNLDRLQTLSTNETVL